VAELLPESFDKDLRYKIAMKLLDNDYTTLQFVTTKRLIDIGIDSTPVGD
jgi:hypothetical protein